MPEKAVEIPEVYRSRSIYHQHPVKSGTFNAGVLVPFYTNSDILPGDTVKLDLRSLIRMSTPIGVPMDNLYMDVAFYFVPNRRLLRRQSFTPSTNDGNRSWEAISGAQDGAINAPVPSRDGIKMAGIDLAPTTTPNTPKKGGLWDWFGQAMYSGGHEQQVTVNPMETLAYFDIWNEEWRDPNGSMNRIFFTVNSGDRGLFNGYFTFSGGPGTGSDNYFYGSGTTASPGGNRYLNQFGLLPVCRFHGYFGSCLPWPQRNLDPVNVPLGSYAGIGIMYNGQYITTGAGSEPTITLSGPEEETVNGLSGGEIKGSFTRDGSTVYGNLVANLANAVGATVNMVRASFAQQKYFEALARGGNSSYADLVAAIWGVNAGVKLDKPELLAIKRIPLNIIQVNDTASDLGKTGSFSHTRDDSYMFTKSFVEHGVLVGVCCVRHQDTLSQGIDKKYFRGSMFDYFVPQYAHIGEEPVYEKEIYFTGNKTLDDAVFGYMEYGSEYRIAQNKVCGELRPGESLEYWTAACKFESGPSLGSFLDARAQAGEIDRLLKVAHTTSGFQFVGQFCCDMILTRLIPTHSTPGYIDHD